MIVPAADVPADAISEGESLPERYCTTRWYALLRVCERMGWSLEQVLGLRHADQEMVLRFEQVRQQEEAAERLAMVRAVTAAGAGGVGSGMRF